MGTPRLDTKTAHTAAMTGPSKALDDPDDAGIDLRLLAVHTLLLPMYVGIVGSYTAVSLIRSVLS